MTFYTIKYVSLYRFLLKVNNILSFIISKTSKENHAEIEILQHWRSGIKIGGVICFSEEGIWSAAILTGPMAAACSPLTKPCKNVNSTRLASKRPCVSVIRVDDRKSILAADRFYCFHFQWRFNPKYFSFVRETILYFNYFVNILVYINVLIAFLSSF